MRRTEKGSLTVEALVFLIPFIMAFCTIINGARFVQAEMLIHHAITQTAKQISTYSYVLTKAGITEKMQNTNGKSEEFTDTVDGAVSSIEGFAEAVGDPEGLAEGIFSLAKSEGEQYLMTQIAGTITRDNIENAIETLSDDPDEYLRNIGIVDGISGLNFSKSKWNSNTEGKGNIEIIVTYEMKNLLFPDFDFGSYHCSQSAATLIW
ncbi:MAG: hypothetical protein ACOX8H_13485 [Ruminococcus sp.]|jgi:hypothetical protein